MAILTTRLLAAWLLMWLCGGPLQARQGGTSPGSAASSPCQRAYFAAGCFWKVQYIFNKVPGVTKTRAGYMGGATKNPTYQQVCSHTTGHAETVEVIYDPQKVTYESLLQVFFANHDPTTMNRQGPDSGTNYRSAIFCVTPEQKREALQYKDKLDKQHKFRQPVVTQIEDALTFYPAEEYHQDYYQKHGAICY